MRYAQINFETRQMQGGPKNLPVIWTTPEGTTLNGFNKLPKDALYGLGWIPAVYEDLMNPETHKHSLIPVYDDTSRSFIYPAVARNIGLLKAEALRAIDQAAGEACAGHISQGVGQEMRYIKKAEQARAFINAYDAGGDPDPLGYPMIEKEAEAVGVPAIDRARLIVDVADMWEIVGSDIEAARMGGKTAVLGASDNAGVITERDNALVALEAL
jgi:hypothetical protein